jgi:hypothetical protein
MFLEETLALRIASSSVCVHFVMSREPQQAGG